MPSALATSWPRALVGVTCLVVAISLAGCGRLGFDAAGGDAAGFDGTSGDAVDACTWSTWGAPTVLSNLSTPGGAGAPTHAAAGV